MMYTSLRRKFDPDRDAGPHPQLLSALLFPDNYRASGTLTLVQSDDTKKAGAEYLLDISATRLSLYETL